MVEPRRKIAKWINYKKIKCEIISLLHETFNDYNLQKLDNDYKIEHLKLKNSFYLNNFSTKKLYEGESLRLHFLVSRRRRSQAREDFGAN